MGAERTTFVATATPPQPLVHEGAWGQGAGYLTRGRAFKWNWMLRLAMKRWDVEVVDMWSPLDPRMDDRTDISSYCHRCGLFLRGAI